MNERKRKKCLRNKTRKLKKKNAQLTVDGLKNGKLMRKKLLQRFDDTICKFSLPPTLTKKSLEHLNSLPANGKPNQSLKRNIDQVYNGKSNNIQHTNTNSHVNLLKQNGSSPQSKKNPSALNSGDLSLQRKSLPIFGVRRALLKELKKNSTVIIMGETGSGKTTQIPQYLHEEGMNKTGSICITQPRRVAAISIAKRVAEEMNTSVGGVVGYSVRFEEAFSSKTKIKFVTDGMLLREAILDPLLLKYRWVLLDEAHERSLNTDVLFGIVKQAQKKRRLLNKVPLQIIVMSATMDINHLSSYFGNACTITIEGRQHPIKLFHSKDSYEDYASACMTTVFQIHREAPPQEDILIFLTGQEEIDAVTHMLRHTANDPSLQDLPTLKVYPFYAALPSHKEHFIFRPSSKGERKVIVSTNVAETSVTIPGIKYVIDSGRVKVRTFNPNSGFDILKVMKISQAQAHQRSGRAGREAPGVCYRTYTLQEYNTMAYNTVPDILRSNLSNVILQLLAIGVHNVADFDFIDRPSMDHIREAETCLRDLGAINVQGKNWHLTDLGEKMASFPLDPRYSKVLLSAATFGCIEEIASIIAVLSSESVYTNPTHSREEASEAHSKFSSTEGDHISLLRIFRAFKSSKETKEWCRNNFFNFRNLSYAVEVRKQLIGLCQRKELPINSCGKETEPILRSIIAGLFSNVAELQLNGKYISLSSRQEVCLHPSSTLFGSKPPYVVYTELVKTGKKYMHIISSVDPQWLVDINSEYFRTRHLKKPHS